MDLGMIQAFLTRQICHSRSQTAVKNYQNWDENQLYIKKSRYLLRKGWPSRQRAFENNILDVMQGMSILKAEVNDFNPRKREATSLIVIAAYLLTTLLLAPAFEHQHKQHSKKSCAKAPFFHLTLLLGDKLSLNFKRSS